MAEYLKFLAGAKALHIIKEKGLRPESVRVIAGAAGGPKFLILTQLDRAIFGSWLKNASQLVFLIGSSIAAWRFAAACQKNPLKAIKRLEEAYINQRYESEVSALDVSLEGERILNAYLDEDKVREVLAHPFFRMNILAVRSRGIVAREKKLPLMAGLAAAYLANLVNRRLLGFFLERNLFYDPRDIPPFFDLSGFPVRKIPLNENNLQKAILASGSIPLVMTAVTDIPGAAAGVYRDGGLIDYHLDIPFMKNDRDIVLYPHYIDRIIPGWLDKRLTWRGPSPQNMANVLLVAPSKNFLNRLPYQKIPDRDDFKTFYQRDQERVHYWKTAVGESQRLAEEFLQAVESGEIREMVQPMM